MSSLRDQLHTTSLDNIRMQREVVTLRRDKGELVEEVEDLKQKLTERKDKENQFQPRITELTLLLTTRDATIQTQVTPPPPLLPHSSHSNP